MFLSFLLLQCQDSDDNGSNQGELDQILVFTKTAGFRHQSIEKGVSTLRNLGNANNFEITNSEDSSIFTQSGLSEYDLIIFLSTTQDILNEQQQEAFENYINAGGSFMGIHAASDTEYDWPWYGRLVGAYFESHPNNPNVRMATLEVINANHPSTSHLDSSWERRDEWYNFMDINPDIVTILNRKTLRPIDLNIHNLNCYYSSGGHCLIRINYQVLDDLTDLTRIYLYWMEICRKRGFAFRLRAMKYQA